MKKRRLKYGSNSIVLTISIIGIVIILNVLLFNNNARLDMTKNKLNSLSDQTEKVLSDLDKEVKIIGFFKEDSNLLPDIASLLKEYKHETGKITYSLIDLDANPIEARQYGVTEYDTVVVESGDNTIEIPANNFYQVDFRSAQKVFSGEKILTQGIIDATSETQNKVYMIGGHGELSNDKTHWFRKSIKGEGYKLEDLNIAEANGIPEDTDLLVIPGPTKDYTPDEIYHLIQYAEKGGRILLLMQPFEEKEKISNLAMFVSTLGVDLNSNIAIDAQRNAFQDPFSIIPEYKIHPITNELKEAGLAVIMPFSLGLEQSDNIKKGFVPMLSTSSNSWGETNFKTKEPKFDENDDKGPLTVAAYVEKSGKEKPMKAIVIGNAFIATNEIINLNGNEDLLMNSINYLQDKEDKLSIRPKTRQSEPLTLKGNEGNYLFGILVIGIPAIILIIGMVIFIRRKNR